MRESLAESLAGTPVRARQDSLRISKPHPNNSQMNRGLQRKVLPRFLSESRQGIRRAFDKRQSGGEGVFFGRPWFGQKRSRQPCSSQDLPDHMTVHIRQAAVDALVTKCQLLMVYAEQV